MKRFMMIVLVLGGLMVATASDAMADHRHSGSGRSRFAISVNSGSGFNNYGSSYGRAYGRQMGSGGYYGGGYVYGNLYPTFSQPIYGLRYGSVPIYGGGYSSVPIYGVGYGGYNGYGLGYTGYGLGYSAFNAEIIPMPKSVASNIAGFVKPELLQIITTSAFTLCVRFVCNCSTTSMPIRSAQSLHSIRTVREAPLTVPMTKTSLSRRPYFVLIHSPVVTFAPGSIACCTTPAISM